ncbi:argininosuccinate synthase [Fastidiosibacter lacustris]|uniref:argininosuccinate synthase n=1 Tax=Fastidiosibacter lacustris TaxID=2056695 RepID=UPI000E34CC69|nr:argininosuccinate synthase [Fastidiosibacter lacustris]
MKISSVKVVISNTEHCCFAKAISHEIAESAKQRKTGIAMRSVDYLQTKMRTQHAVIAIDTENEEVAGFCYIESWQDKSYVSNSGLIVFPKYRSLGLAKALKEKAFELARLYYPNARIFGLTTNPVVMKINCELGYQPTSFAKLTHDMTFWQGCQSCVNFSILQSKNYQNCLCTGMLYEPNNHKPKEQKMKVIVAFSGGLDTSFCVKYLQQEKNLEVHTVTVNTGGFSKFDLAEIEKRAYQLGATTHQNIDATNDFYNHCVKYLIFGNVLKNNCYPLSVSAERAFQSMVIANKANELGINKIAHGCTGAGNDQVRFDLMFHILCSNVEIITPIRDLSLTRAQTQAYLIKHGIECSDKTKKYSINKGLWGTSIGGVETLSSHLALPEEAWSSQMTKSLSDEEKVKITFLKGEPIALNDELSNPIQLIKKLNELASCYAIGRDIHVGDTIINIKGRVGFEAPAPMVLIKAHHCLEKHVLTKAQLKLKDQLACTYGEMVHEGQFMDPALRDIENFLSSTQLHVSGNVFIKLKPWYFTITGIESDYDLMQQQGAQYGEGNTSFSGQDVRGFSKILSNQLAAYHQKLKNKQSNQTTKLVTSSTDKKAHNALLVN